jgi:hypothetical protein
MASTPACYTESGSRGSAGLDVEDTISDSAGDAAAARAQQRRPVDRVAAALSAKGFEQVRCLRSGGFGRVYEAVEVATQRQVC